MNKNQNKRIEDYLNHQMTVKEIKSFEQELKNNPELQIELNRFVRVEKVIGILGRKKMDNLLIETKNEAGSLVSPKIQFLDKVKYFFYAKTNLFLVFALLLFLLSFLLLKNSIHPIEEYFIEPAIIHVVAGASTNYSVANRYSSYYLENQANKLEQASTNKNDAYEVANYYLAHLYFKSKKYTLAKNSFSEAILSKKELEKYNEFQDMHLLKFNQILSEFAEGADRNKIATALESLQQKINNDDHKVSRRIDKLLSDLKVQYYIFK